MNLIQSNAEMMSVASLFDKQSRGTKQRPSASASVETATGVQRELRFGENEERTPEEATTRGNLSGCLPEPRESATEPSPEAASEVDEPFVLACETTLSDGSAGHVRHFAVALDGLVRPRDAEEQKRALRAANAWHRDLLGFLSRWPSSTEFRLRYQTTPAQDWDAPRKEKRQLSASLIVTTEERTAQAAGARARQIVQELQNFLRSQRTAAGPTYDFRPVTSEEALHQRLVPFAGGKGLHLSRRTVPLENSGRPGMGFGANSREPAEPKVPIAVGIPAAGRHLSHLFRAMLWQSTPSLLDVRLCPSPLEPGELRRLRSLARGEVTDGTTLSGNEEEAIVAFSEDLIQSGCCFEVEVVLAQDRTSFSHAFQAAAERALFGEAGNAETREVPLEERSGLLSLRPGDASKGDNPGAAGGCRESEDSDAGTGSGRLGRLYSTERAIQLFRLPAPVQQEIPGIRGVHPATCYLPPGLSGEGPFLGEKTVQVGLEKSNIAVRVHPEDMFHHVYILGQTGTGKTTMLGSMIGERLEAGAGVGLIDPHGDLYNRIRQVVPPERRDDVVLLDPTDEDSNATLNLLEYAPDRPRQRTTLINELLQIFDQEYDLKQTGGPIFERYMRNALLLVMDDPDKPGTLLDVVRLFQEREFRGALLAQCDNERVLRFWEEAENTPTSGELPSPENMSIYVTSKLSRFLDDDYLRALVDQRRSTLDFQAIIDGRKILLVKMSKGKLSQLGVRMFGTVVVARLMMAALSREEIPEKERRDFFLFVDEFQNFTTPTIANLLSEARKFRLSLTLANQTLYQLDDEIVNAVLGNAGSLVALRPGVKDYERIEPYVSPPFRREDLINLPNYKAVGRLLVRGEPTQPFLFRTAPN